MTIYIDTSISKIAHLELRDDATVFANKDGVDSLLLLSQLMEEHKLKPEDIDELIIHEGPGSFTGLRVAAAIANSWNWLHGKTKIITPMYKDVPR